MPKYIYQCSGCAQTFEAFHSFNEKYETCSDIDAQCGCAPNCSIMRIPQEINYMKKKEQKTKVGDLVKQHIEEAKKEVKEYKEEIKNWSPEK